MTVIRRVLLFAVGLGSWISAAAALAADTPTAIFVMKVDGSEVRRVAEVAGRLATVPRWSHDGEQLVFDAGVPSKGDADRRLYVVQADGSGMRTLGVGAAADWSPDDKQLVFCVAGNDAASSGIFVQNANGQGRVRLADSGIAPRWSPRGEALLFLEGGTMVVLDLFRSEQRALDLPAQPLPGFDLSPDGKRIAVVTGTENEKQLWIVDTQGERPTKRFAAAKLGPNLSWSPDGKRLAIAIDGKMHLLEVGSEAPPALIPGQEDDSTMPAFSPDGQWLAFISTRATPTLARVTKTTRKVKLEEMRRHTRGGVVYGVDLSPDGRQALLGGTRDLEIWNLDTDETANVKLPGEWVSLSPDGHTVAQCGRQVKVMVGDIGTGKRVRDLHSGGVCTNADFPPDGKLVVSGTINDRVLVWEVDTGKQVCVFDKHDAPIMRVAFLPGGREVASNGQDKHLRVWNAKTGEQRLALEHPAVVWGLAVSPDGRLIATGTGGKTEGNPIMHRIVPDSTNVIRLWDAASGELVREMKGHTAVVHTMAFTPDGRTLVTGSWDGSLRLWDVASGDELAKAQGAGSVFIVAVTPDGTRIVVGGGENRTAGQPIRRYRDEQVRLYRIVEE